MRYRGRSLVAIGGRGTAGNFMDEASREEFWVSGVKARGSNVHPGAAVSVVVDEDAVEDYERLREAT